MNLAILLSLALAATPPPASSKAPLAWDRTFTIAKHASVTVRCDDAKVRVHSHDEPTVVAHVTRREQIRGVFIGKLEPKVEFAQNGDAVDIVAQLHGEVSGIVVWMDTGMEVDVWVPREADVDVRTEDGPVRLENLSGEISATTGDGRIEAQGIRGTVSLHTSDGRIEATGLEGALDARTSDGHIDVAGRFDKLALHTQDGAIAANARPGSRLASAWTIESGDGRITLRIPVKLNALLDARTDDGRIHVQLPLRLDRGRDSQRLSGQLNDGGPLLWVRSHDGSITLALSQ